MAGYPLWANSPAFQFQETFFRDGFNGLFHVKSTDPLGFFQLLAYILFLHQSKHYPQIEKTLNIAWAKRVAPVVAVFQTATGEALTDLAWWEKAGKSCRDIIIAYFTEIGKEYLVKRPKANMPITHNDTQFLDKLAKEFFLCLVWIENQSEGLNTQVYQPDTTGEIGLCVYLAEGSESLSLLIHQNIDEVPEGPALSHYILVNEGVKHYSPSVSQQRVSIRVDVAEEKEKAAAMVLWQAKDGIINALAHIILSISDTSLPDPATSGLHDLRKSLSTCQEAMALAPSIPNEAQLALLQEITERKLVPVKCLPRQHTVQNCDKNQGTEPLTKLCTHLFHEGCIRIYIESMHAGNQDIRCPVCGNLFSPQEIQSISPETHKKLLWSKSFNFQQATTGSLSHQGSFDLPISSYQTMPTQYTKCCCCPGWLNMGGNHGSHICSDCFKNAAHSTRTCPVCSQYFTAEDYAAGGLR